VLNRAIEACRGILHVRTRDSDPLGWAAFSDHDGKRFCRH
jgi:hypothetical protein